MTDPIPSPAPPDELSLARMFRRFFQILALLFCLFLVGYTTFVEPHGVSTGSMAPTIFGNRRECPCPRCGFPLVVGAAAEDARIDPQLAAYCPNCGLTGVNVVPLSDEISGDRLMVDKLVYRLRSPRRWEAAVFHAPDGSKIPYVKRVVGLPGEAIRIRDGDAYSDGELLRKPLDAIREMKVAFFDMDHPPVPMGWNQRWVVEPLAAAKLPGTDAASPTVTVESVVRGTELVLDASAGPRAVLGVGYRNREVDPARAALAKPDGLIRDDLGYNGSRGVPKPVHDFIAECELEILAGSGTFSIRFGDGSDTVRLDLPIANPSQPAMLSHDGGTAPVSYPASGLTAAKRYRLELAFVDRRAFVVVDGNVLGPPLVIVVPKLGSPDALPPDRRGTDRPVHFEVRGASVVVRHLKLARDVHYRSEGDHGISGAFALAADEYFMMGDNSAASEDSRAWKKAGVPEGSFIGKPFLVHQPLRTGRVALNGNEHRFRTIDWDRFRLLR